MRSDLFVLLIFITTFYYFNHELCLDKGCGSPAFSICTSANSDAVRLCLDSLKESYGGFATRFERVVICGIVLFFKLRV